VPLCVARLALQKENENPKKSNNMPSEKQLKQIKELINNAQLALAEANKLLADVETEDDDETEPTASAAEQAKSLNSSEEDGQKIVEGVFDGQHMVGPDGKQYAVPANYASKSKLVEGDVLKLIITEDGSFIYKQIGPVERKRKVGKLMKDAETGDFRVLSNGKQFRVLLASITYFKGEVADEVVILVPESRESQWAAVENIIKEGGAPAPAADDLDLA
jgi:hypothetical protein